MGLRSGPCRRPRGYPRCCSRCCRSLNRPKPQIQPLGCATQKLPSTCSCLETVLCSEGSFSASLPGLATCIPSISDAGGNRANCTFGDLHDFKQVFVSNCVDSSWHF